MDQGDYFETSNAPPQTLEDFWESEEIRRNEELTPWLDEFLASEEFAEYMKRKSQRLDEATKISGDYFQEKAEEIGDQKPKKHQHTLLLYEKLQRALKRREITNTVANQKLGIKMIKAKILEAQTFYKSRKPYNERLIEKEREEIIKILKTQYNIDLPHLTTKSKLVDKVLAVRKRKEDANRKKNSLHIVKKILHDAKRDAEIAKAKAKTYDYKVKPQERIVKNMVVVGTKIILSPRPKEEVIPVVEEDEVEEPPEAVLEEEEAKPKKSNKGKKDAKSDSDKSKTEKDEKINKKDSKHDSAERKKKNVGKKAKDVKIKAGTNLVLPVAPNTNKRAKIKFEECMMTALLEDFGRLEEYLKDKRYYTLEQSAQKEVYLEEDIQLFSVPAKIIFKDFINGEIYKKKVTLTNGGSYAKKLRFDRIIWNADIDDDLLLEVEPIGIQKLYPGLGFHFEMRFNPETLHKTTMAKVLFVTYTPGINMCKQYVLRIACIPNCSEIVISPKMICFEETPIWRALKLKVERKNYKLLKITNRGCKECRVVITKAMTPETIDQAWRNIISILAIDSEDSQPINSGELGFEDGKIDRFPRNLVEECVENVFNVFRFERMIMNIPGSSEKLVKVWFSNIDGVGYHVEIYMVSVYERFPDKKLYCIGTQDVVVSAETTGHFLHLNPELLDFEVCVFGSAYQLSFDVYNSANLPHKVRIRFPATLRDYLTCSINDITVQALKSTKIFIKFIPKQGIIEENPKFYDSENDLLEFPIYVCIYTLGYEDTPFMSLYAFAAVTEPLGLVLRPLAEQHCEIFEDEYVLDLGVCTSSETVYTEIELQNVTLAPQHYGFLDLPQCITVHPNFGFGHLRPMETTTLCLYFSPEKQDLQMKAVNKDSNSASSVFFNISVNTVKNLGALKKTENFKKISKELRKLEQIVANPRAEDTALMSDISELFDLLRSNTNVYTPSTVATYSRDVVFSDKDIATSVESNEYAYKSGLMEEEKVLDVVVYDNFASDNASTEKDQFNTSKPLVRSNRMWIKALVTTPLGDFSHQLVNFPRTPCGSYSLMTLDFRALKNVIELRPGKKLLRPYKAYFEIKGNSEEISIEPTVGDLKSGEKIKVYLLAKPQTPQHIIEEKAKALKVAELIEKKRREIKEQRLQKIDINTAKSKQKGNKDKKGKTYDKGTNEGKGDKGAALGAAAEEEEPEIIIDENDIIVGYFDYYPAEMCIWRNLEPYFIEAEFCCTITYSSDKYIIPSDKIYIQAKCCVIQPQFIHDLNLQEIDFGKVAIGMKETKLLSLQNIQCEDIYPEVKALCPLGGYSTIELRDQVVPPEFILKMPITFTPLQERFDIEYFEMVSESTVYPFILKGEGIQADISFSPNFVICRMEAVRNGNTQCSFDIQNLGHCPITICLTKLCELEGDIRAPAEVKPGITKMDKKSKNGKEKADKNSKNSGKELKRPKFSAELMGDEEFSMENFFKKRDAQAQSFFEVLGNDVKPDSFAVNPESKCAIKVRFGYPPPPPKAKDKGKNGKGGKLSGKIEKSSRSNEDKIGKNKIYYVAKYNVTLGRRTHLKDIIIVGTFK